MDHPDGKARRVALDLANTIPGQKTTQAWLEKMKTAAPEVKAEIVAMLGRRGDQGALPFLFDALNDKDEIVRMSAIEASAALGGPKALPQLLAFLKTDRAGEIQKTAEILGRLPGDETTAAIAGALPSVSPESRAALIEVLGLRRAKDFVETIFPYTGNDSRSVRVAAIKVLGDLADASALPRLIQVLLNTESSGEQAAARKAVVALCRQVPDAESQSDALLEALGKAKSAKQKAVLMKAIAQIGTQKGLEAIVAEIGVEDEAVRDGAIRALADWEDIRAATDMLQVARSAELPAHRILALQGYIRVIGGAKLSPDAKLEMYKKASSAAERPEEKRLVLSGLAGIKTVESLEAVGGFLDDVDFRSEAALTAVTIALPQNENEEGLRGEIVESVLTKALGSISDVETRRQVQEYLAILQRPDEANLALGKPVKASVHHQLDFTPEKAVDGDKRKYSHWDGVSWPCWFQVDLTEAVRIESVHILFYWDDSRYCQYTVEASTDETHWTQVADRSQTREKSTFRGDLHVFEPIEARYVRINILRNSANTAAHIVELSVYGEGKTPARLFAPEFDEEGFTDLFNGRDLTGWTGNTEGYVAEDGKIVVHPELGGGNLYTAKEYADFILRFEFKLTPGANNGLGIRAPLEGNAAYLGMELQILDNTDDQYKDLKPYQYHGSIYGVVPAKREFLKPVGEWNTEEVIARGKRITVILNGHTIVDADIGPAIESGTMDGQEHPGLKRTSGHIGFLGHGSRVEFRNLRIKELPPAEKEEGFESLFDGSTLTGWKIHQGLPDGVGGKWTVEDGAIAGVQDPPGQGGFFTTERSFRDFDLRLESKIDWPFDSGVFLRVGPDGKSHQVTLDYRSGGEIGGIYCPWTQGFVSHCAEGMDLWKKDEWNDLRIVCEGEPARIRVWLNGRLITDFQHTEETTRGVPEAGTICLQVHPGGKASIKARRCFRNIRIREIASEIELRRQGCQGRWSALLGAPGEARKEIRLRRFPLPWGEGGPSG